MDKSFYGLSGYEPNEIYKSREEIVRVVLRAHLFQVDGKTLVRNAPHYINGTYSHMECKRGLVDDIIYNLDRFANQRIHEDAQKDAHL